MSSTSSSTLVWWVGRAVTDHSCYFCGLFWLCSQCFSSFSPALLLLLIWTGNLNVYNVNIYCEYHSFLSFDVSSIFNITIYFYEDWQSMSAARGLGFSFDSCLECWWFNFFSNTNHLITSVNFRGLTPSLSCSYSKTSLRPAWNHHADKQILTQSPIRWSIIHGPITFIDRACFCVNVSMYWSMLQSIFIPIMLTAPSLVTIVTTASWCCGPLFALVHVEHPVVTLSHGSRFVYGKIYWAARLLIIIIIIEQTTHFASGFLRFTQQDLLVTSLPICRCVKYFSPHSHVHACQPDTKI